MRSNQAAFRVSGGRDLIKNFDELNAEQLQRQQLAMRSFSESIEVDTLSMVDEIDNFKMGKRRHSSTSSQNSTDDNNQLSNFYDSNNHINLSQVFDYKENSMKESSTIDTIIEVLNTSKQSKTNETLGETQKYAMTVPGPGHLEQEIELHKSLIKDIDNHSFDGETNYYDNQDIDLLNKQLQHVVAMTEAAEKALQNKQFSTNINEAGPNFNAQEEYNKISTLRPRPTTPVAKSNINCLANNTTNFMKTQLIEQSAKIFVTIPSSVIQQSASRRHSSTNAKNVFIEQPSWQTETSEDLLEVNPEYARNAPPKPVVHRRSSIDWENFSEKNESTQNNSKTLLNDNFAATSDFDQFVPVLSKKAKNCNFKFECSNNKPNYPTKLTRNCMEDSKLKDVWSGEKIERFKPQISTPLSSPTVLDNFTKSSEDNQNLSENVFKHFNSANSNYKSEDNEQKEKCNLAEQSSFTPLQEQNSFILPIRTAPSPPVQSSINKQQEKKQILNDINNQLLDNADYTNYSNNQFMVNDQNDDNYTQQYQDYNTDPSYQTIHYDTYEEKNNSLNNTYYSNNYENKTDYSNAESYDTNFNQNATFNTINKEQNNHLETETYDTSAYGTVPKYDVNTNVYSVNSLENYDNSQQYSEKQKNNNSNNTSFYNQDSLTLQTEKLPPTEPINFIQPIFFPQRTKTPDPFSWEVQETAYATYDSAVSPLRPPLMVQSPAFCSNTNDLKSYTQKNKNLTENTEEKPIESSLPPPRPKALPPSRPPAPKVNTTTTTIKKNIESCEEEDPWAKFKQMTDQVSSIVKSTTEQLKNLSETSAANDIKDETYIAQIGGNQGFELNLAQKQIFLLQEEKKKKKANKKLLSPTFDLKKEADIELQQKELVQKMVATHSDLANWKPPSIDKSPLNLSFQNKQNVKETIVSLPADNIKTDEEQKIESFSNFSNEEIKIAETEEEKDVDPVVDRQNWAGFDDFNNKKSMLPTSDSDFFSKTISKDISENNTDPFIVPEDPFAPIIDSTNNDAYDPFNTLSAEDIIAKTRKLIEHEHKSKSIADTDIFGANLQNTLSASRRSSVTPEGGSPASSRPIFFDDDFCFEKEQYLENLTPLYDEDDTVPLTSFLELYPTDGWDLMIRHPLKKKIMGDRFWKPCFVRIESNMILIFNDRNETKPYQEILIQTSYLLSDLILQAYDVYGKIHTTKLQHILYKERLGIRAGQISRLVEGHITKYGLPLEHAAQCLVLAKFGSLKEETILSFVHCVENLLFKCITKRETIPIYKQDEVQVHCYDEYSAHVDKDGFVSNQKARVRFFCLAFLTGSPYIEIGLNDRRRQGKEIVRRKDILPLYTERWIRFENIEFHNTVENRTFEEDQVIRFQPPDGCFFEVMRFRVRPPKNREKPLIVKSIMKICGSKIEINIKVVAASHQQFVKGTVDSSRTIPCEDIQIRFPIPEAWIYIFREERHWGVGTVHSKTRRTGKIKNLRDRLIGAVQHNDSTLIEVAIGEAKYEHVYRSLVWRIPRLPEKHHTAYKSHALKCRFDLSSFDLMPETFLPTCDVEFTMPLATISNTVVRSISIEQHEDSDRVEKFVRYVAKCKYDIEVDYVHCNNLDEEIAIAKLPASESADALTKQTLNKHVSAFDPESVNEHHTGYVIDSNAADSKLSTVNNEWLQQSADNEFANIQNVDDSSSSDDDNDNKPKVPMIEINMQGYGY